MIEDIRLPEISENVEAGDVTKVLVAVGDTVEVDQPLVELETDKAVFELPSTVAGTVTEVLVKEGDTAKSGRHWSRWKRRRVRRKRWRRPRKNPYPTSRKSRRSDP